MIEYSYIVGPLVGGVIGYITNALAIRMLFRPYTAKYLFGMKLPFTPGIIPKEKGRIATSIGGAISENLMSREVLEKNLLSDEMVGKIRSGVEGFFAEQANNPETLREFLLHFLSEDDVNTVISSVRTEFTGQIARKLEDSSIGSTIADAVVGHVTSKLRIDGLDISLGPVGKMFGGPIWGKLADLIAEPAKRFLSKNINKMLRERGPEIVDNMLTAEIDNLASTPVKTLLAGRDAQISQFCDTIVSLYRRLISEQLPRILSTINIPAIIESRINEMDMRETEKLIFQVMDKELKAIIWLGALLGLIMGSVNALI